MESVILFHPVQSTPKLRSWVDLAAVVSVRELPFRAAGHDNQSGELDRLDFVRSQTVEPENMWLTQVSHSL